MSTLRMLVNVWTLFPNLSTYQHDTLNLLYGKDKGKQHDTADLPVVCLQYLTSVEPL
jgi:hypothetical protein